MRNLLKGSERLVLFTLTVVVLALWAVPALAIIALFAAWEIAVPNLRHLDDDGIAWKMAFWPALACRTLSVRRGIWV